MRRRVCKRRRRVTEGLFDVEHTHAHTHIHTHHYILFFFSLSPSQHMNTHTYTKQIHTHTHIHPEIIIHTGGDKQVKENTHKGHVPFS
jgi:hypothetical protein